MSIDKSLYAAPQGLAAEPIQVEIEDPEAVHIEGPGFEMHMEKHESDFYANLAEEIDESYLQSISYELLGDLEEDISARKEWLDIYVKGMKLLGLKYEERAEPWPGASGVFHPLLMESAVKFQAEMTMETFPAAGPVRTVIVGKETPEKKAAALRVEADMNYELTQRMVSYRPEHEKCLLTTALAGNSFKKIYFDPSVKLPEAPFIPPEDLIVPYGASSIETAERITHRMRKTKNELRKLQVAGFYRDIDLGDPVRVMDEVEKEKARSRALRRRWTVGSSCWRCTSTSTLKGTRTRTRADSPPESPCHMSSRLRKVPARSSPFDAIGRRMTTRNCAVSTSSTTRTSRVLDSMRSG